MRRAGIDIGSRTVKLVVLEDDLPVFARVVFNTHDPLQVCRELLDAVSWDELVATGYGRHLLESRVSCRTVTEIRAATVGARALQPDCGTILDIGGQDTKAIRLASDGKIDKFEMNDKCAAGTGRFLEIMASALGWTPDEFEQQAAKATGPHKVNAMCTVFAESEVVSALARGTDRAALARGIHEAIAGRAATLCKRVGIVPPVLFCGGVAHNQLLRQILSEQLQCEVIAPPEPQTVAAYGAALLK